ncbi:cytochrome P450 [Kitasatospora sp. NPDC056076]|uniref:cytochrome P450 n=1 Tax=Kitasatospora sp. NPDC056076 TaxID=3345703 RepID=UPI0035E0F6D7
MTDTTTGTTAVPSPRCPYPFPTPDGRHTFAREDGYDQARASGALLPVTLPHGNPDTAYLATTHEHVKQVLGCPALTRAAANAPDTPRLGRDLLPDLALLSMDGPQHARMRRQVGSTFTPRKARALRPLFEQRSHRLLDDLTAAGREGDLIAAYTDPLTTAMVGDVLGCPVDAADEFHSLADKLTSPCEPDAYALMRARFEEMCDQLSAPGVARPDGLLDELAQARTGPDELTALEVTDLMLTVFAGGARTPSILMSSAVTTLLDNPEQLRTLRKQPNLWPAAVEELLRYIPIGLSGGFPRTAVEDATIGSHTLRAGETVLPSTIAANMDPAVFEQPEELDVARASNPHLAFGHGPHRCPGAFVTKDLAEVALPILFDRLPGLRVATVDHSWQDALIVRAMTALPVTW